MNKYKLTPVITLTREDAQIEAVNDLIAQLLKDPTVGSEVKMAIYEDLLSRIRSYKQVPRHEQEPQMMVRESRTTQTPKKTIRRKEYEVADVQSQTGNLSANSFAQTDTATVDSFAQTAFDQGDFGPLDYSPVIHEVFNRNSPKPARNVVITSSQTSPIVSTAISPNTRTAVSTNTALSPPSHTAVSPNTRTAIAPIRATPRRSETTDQFFDRLAKGGRRQPTRDSPQKTRRFTSTQGGNGFISKKRWAFP